jgi:hypothetical protein
MVNLQELLRKSVEVKPQPSVQTPNDEVEKLAEALEAYAEEDTLLDKLAELAVLVDHLEGKFDGKQRTT